MTEADFWRQIADGDETARLALADWLEERGDVRCAWVRDDVIFVNMLPDGRDPVPAMREMVTFEDDLLDADMIGSGGYDIAPIFAKLGPAGVPCATGLAHLTVYALNEMGGVDEDGVSVPQIGNTDIDEALAIIGPGCVPALLAVAEAAHEGWHTRTAHSLRRMAALAAPALQRALSHDSPQVRGVAALALVDEAPAAAMPVLVEMLERDTRVGCPSADVYIYGIARAAKHVAPPVEELRAVLPYLHHYERQQLAEIHPDIGTDDLAVARRLLAKVPRTGADVREARRIAESMLTDHEEAVRYAAKRLLSRLDSIDGGGANR